MSLEMICLHDKERIEAFLRRDTFLQVYGLGDLDERLWPYTTWYALASGQEIQAIALMYSALSIPVLLALGANELPQLRELVRRIVPLLPASFYAHMSGDISRILGGHFCAQSYGPHYKMALKDPGRLTGSVDGSMCRLSEADLEELQRFYEVSYPQAAFEAGMLRIGPYYALRQGGQIISVAGVHIYSPRYRVAALGNVATHPEHRGKGCAQVVMRCLCRDLLRQVDHVGLNVKADNAAAIRCYESLGFSIIGQYEECMLSPA